MKEIDSWGVDCYTRKLVAYILERSGNLTDLTKQRQMINVLTKLVTSHEEDSAWDFGKAVSYGLNGLHDLLKGVELEKVKQVILSDALSKLNIIELFRSFEGMLEVSKTIDVPIRPKGVGVKCVSYEGIPSGTLVNEYLGELYPPWLWFERQDGVKQTQSKINFKPGLPDFYNIMLERHLDDEEGYDVLFTDPLSKGNFASRLSHSCDPNCATVVMAVNGKYTINVVTIKPISYGEELTFDYSSVTEDEKEYQNAICLCASANCRGSFLYYAGRGAFTSVLYAKHRFLQRSAILLEACAVDSKEEEIFNYFGIKGCVLNGLPEWLVRWSGLVLHYVKYEKEALKNQLVDVNGLDLAKAELEVKGVIENRKQNVVITLDKIGYFLRKTSASDKEQTPLRLLVEEEIIDFLLVRKRGRKRKRS